VKHEEYLEKRNALFAEAQALLDEGKLDEAKAKEQEIKDLDAKYDEIAKARANMQALNASPVVKPLENLGANVAGGTSLGGVATNHNVTDEKEVYRVAFAKAMLGQRLTTEEQVVLDKVNEEFRRTNVAMQTTSEAALLIPETVREGIWREMGELHPIIADLKDAMTFVPGDFTIIKENEDSLASDAAAYDEDDEVGDDDTVSFGEINLTGCELAKAVTVSWKAKKMTVDAFLAYITTKIAEKMGNALAKWVVSGKGKPGTSDTFKAEAYGIRTRILAETDTPQVLTYSDNDPINYTKMTAAMAKMKSGYYKGAVIYATNDMIWNKLANIVDKEGRPMFVPDVTSGGVGRFFGLPVKEEDAIPAGEILIGNVAKGYVMNANENISMYQEDHVKARKTDYMGYAIVDGDVLTTKAFVLIKEAEAAG
jgi:HK97 family phage major capsid protein